MEAPGINKLVKNYIFALFLVFSCSSYEPEKDKNRDLCIYHQHPDGKNHCNKFNLVPINQPLLKQ